MEVISTPDVSLRKILECALDSHPGDYIPLYAKEHIAALGNELAALNRVIVTLQDTAGYVVQQASMGNLVPAERFYEYLISIETIR